MSPLVNVTIHSSQFPEQVQADLLKSLRLHQINHKFHYDSYKQTRKWLELHQAYSPSRADPNCAACYDAAFAAAANQARATSVHLIGLGCGGGQKDTRLLRLLRQNHAQVLYTPVDVSTPMVLVANQVASEFVSQSHPLVCDLSAADDLPALFALHPPLNPRSIRREPDLNDLPAVFAGHTPAHAVRLITFFGMMPNFEPHLVLPKLAALLRPGDLLLLSANLAPGKDYAAGLRQILPLYDNALTTDWLLTFLFDLGVEQTDGVLEWNIESCPTGQDLLRLTAWFHFRHPRSLRVGGEEFQFGEDDKIRLFFSYRHTPERLQSQLSPQGLTVRDQWITASEEEGVFLCAAEC